MRSWRAVTTRVVVSVLAGVVATACGAQPGQPVAASTTSSAPTSTDATSTDATSTDVTGDSSTSTDLTDTSTTDLGGDTTTPGDTGSGGVALDMKVRVANLYLPAGATAGVAIDVWAGYPGGESSRKLVTVPYGQVSDFFAPVVWDGSTAAQHGSYTITFFATGKTASDDQLISQSESASPGQVLTMVVGPSDSGSGGSSQVFVDALGSAPDGSGFSSAELPPLTGGKAAVALNALGVPSSGGSSTSLLMSAPSGTCLPYVEDTSTGKLHDMSSDTMDLAGGTATLIYVTTPGQQVRINKVGDQQSPTDACKDKPVAAFDPQLAAGKGAYAFLYGATVATAKALVVPIASS